MKIQFLINYYPPHKVTSYGHLGSDAGKFATVDGPEYAIMAGAPRDVRRGRK